MFLKHKRLGHLHQVTDNVFGEKPLTVIVHVLISFRARHFSYGIEYELFALSVVVGGSHSVDQVHGSATIGIETGHLAKDSEPLFFALLLPTRDDEVSMAGHDFPSLQEVGLNALHEARYKVGGFGVRNQLKGLEELVEAYLARLWTCIGLRGVCFKTGSSQNTALPYGILFGFDG